jgi:hypothetical protein
MSTKEEEKYNLFLGCEWEVDFLKKGRYKKKKYIEKNV